MTRRVYDAWWPWRLGDVVSETRYAITVRWADGETWIYDREHQRYLRDAPRPATPAPREEQPMGDPRVGLIHKFNITRTDGTSEPGQKHDGCDYFVLDLTHDEFALPALLAYAEACRVKYPLLADDLEARVRAMRSREEPTPSAAT